MSKRRDGEDTIGRGEDNLDGLTSKSFDLNERCANNAQDGLSDWGQSLYGRICRNNSRWWIESQKKNARRAVDDTY